MRTNRINDVYRKTTTRSLRSFGLVLTLLLPLGGCAWVKLTEGGAAVTVRDASAVADCQRMGTVRASTASKVVLRRDARKVQEEIIVQARNETAGSGANVIVPSGPVQDGGQSFITYRCP